MSNLKLPPITDWQGASLHHTLNGDGKIAYATSFRCDDGDYVIRHHGTDIIRYGKEGGCVQLNSGGWHTPTTVNRMRRLTSDRLGVKLQKDQIMVSTDQMQSWRPLIDGIWYAN